MADQRGVYDDHTALLNATKRMTVPLLKDVLKELNNLSDGIPRWPLTGKKQNLVDRVGKHLGSLKDAGRDDLYNRARGCLERVYGSKIAANPRRLQNTWQASPQALGAAPTPVYLAEHPHPYSNGTPSHARPPVPGQTSRWGNFRQSPFYTVKEWVAEATCQPTSHQRDPNTKLVTQLVVHLNDTQRRQLSQSSSLQLRLFCAPHAAYVASFDARHPAPVEFPVTSDVRVNRSPLSINLRGKKTPAKVPPPNLNKDKKLNFEVAYNFVELVYSQTNQKYIMCAAICETYSAESLAENIRKDKLKSKEQILRDMKRAAADEDIEIGDVAIGLKCPLSYMRLQTPSRAEVCTHTQCFDALSFFSVNEQTPSWQCPVCSKVIDPDKLFLDGYVLDILNRVPEDEENVLIDNEGRWRTQNGKFRSDEVSDRMASTVPPPPSQELSSAGADATQVGSQTRVKGEDESAGSVLPETKPLDDQPQRPRKEVEVLDLDDDDTPTPPPPSTHPVNGNVSTSNGSTQPSQNPQAAVARSEGAAKVANGTESSSDSTLETCNTRKEAVIDLTLSDSEDEGPPPPRANPLSILAPLPAAHVRRPGPNNVRPSHTPANPAWDLLGRLSSANENQQQPIYGGTFGGYRPPTASAWSMSPAPPQASSDGTVSATASSSATVSGSDASVSVNAPAPPLASRIGGRIADPYTAVDTPSSNGEVGSLPRNTSHANDTGDDSLPVTRKRKRPTRNSAIFGRNDEDEDDDEFEAEFRGVDFDDLELEMEAGLAETSQQSRGEDTADHGGAEDPPPGTTTANDKNRNAWPLAARSPQQRDRSESSDGLHEDERAGLAIGAGS